MKNAAKEEEERILKQLEKQRNSKPSGMTSSSAEHILQQVGKPVAKKGQTFSYATLLHRDDLPPEVDRKTLEVRNSN